MKQLVRGRSLALLCLLLLLAGSPCGGRQLAQGQPVRLRILAPQENAKLWIFNTQYLPTGLERNFISTPIGPGNYYYDLKVFWEPNNYTKITRRKRIQVQAGKSYVVDLRKKNPEIPDDIKVRYVPTPQVVVEQMLKLGKVSRNDVVFDLGCGDGRFVVTAVSKFGAKRGVGVDIDPQRIVESRANARRSGVSDKVVLREGDVLKKIDGLLAKLGSNKSCLLSATIYLSDIRHFDAMNAAWDAWVDKANAPARATVQALLATPQYLVEIMVTAHKKEG